MVKLHPHSAVITWNDSGTKDGNGVYTEGAQHSVTVSCNIQPQSGRYLIKGDGDRIDYGYVVFCGLFGEAGEIAKNGHIAFLSAKFKILRLDVYQKHVEIRC